MAHGTYGHKRSGSTASALRMQKMVNKVNGKGKEVIYDGGYEAPGMHNYAEKQTVKNTKDGKYTKHGWSKGKRIVKTTNVTDDTPYHGKKGQHSKQTLTKTKRVSGPNKTTTKTKEKAITNKRAERIKSRIRKHDPSIKTNRYGESY